MDFLCAMGNKGGKSGSLSEPNMERSQTCKKKELNGLMIYQSEWLLYYALKQLQQKSNNLLLKPF